MSHKVAYWGRIVCALCFLCGAVLQYNDPDPLRWVAIYLSAMVACLLAGRFARSWILPLAVASVALLWAASIARQMPTWVAPAQMFEAMETKGGAVEMARETWGLGIMALLLVGVSTTALQGLRSSS